MKNAIIIGLALITAAFASCGDAEEKRLAHFDSIQRDYENPWGQTHAELIAGRPVRFSEAGASSNNLWYSHTTKFVSAATDSFGQLSMLEFNFLEFIDLDSAKRSYALNKEYYLDDGRVEDLTGMGDEAFFQTDDSLFYFVFVRKGARELRIRLEYLSPLTTKENLISAAKEITEAM